MGSLKVSQLNDGVIFGDIVNREFIYIPAGECGADSPIPVYEHDGISEDIPLNNALELITRRSLKPSSHPRLGKKSF